MYDRDSSKSIDREDLVQMFSSMLLQHTKGGKSSEASPALKELIDDFVDTIYDSFDQDPQVPLGFEQVASVLERKPEITDVWEVFGRTLISRI